MMMPWLRLRTIVLSMWHYVAWLTHRPRSLSSHEGVMRSRFVLYVLPLFPPKALGPGHVCVGSHRAGHMPINKNMSKHKVTKL